MSTKVNKLLDMARLQAGKVQLNRQWQPLEEVVGSALKATERALGGTFAVSTILPDESATARDRCGA
jgi:two-component system sensor histidine kinase KdpD